MIPLRRTGAGSSAIALVLVLSLGGGPQLLELADEPEHRCGCPVGAHACACPRCAKAARAAAARREPPAAGRPCCHGHAAAAPAPEQDPERPRTPPDGPCVSPSCGGRGAVAALAADGDPFVLPQHALAAPSGRPERFLVGLRLVGATPPAPEPPPPRA